MHLLFTQETSNVHICAKHKNRSCKKQSQQGKNYIRDMENKLEKTLKNAGKTDENEKMIDIEDRSRDLFQQ